MDKFDVIVVGTGAGGSTVAGKVRAAGKSVAIVDSRPFGGTCALRGCDPKKVLAGVTHLIDAVRRLEGKGLASAPSIEWGELMAFKRGFTEPVPEARERSYEKRGITALRGPARFVDRTTLEVGGRKLAADRIHLAPGATPARLGFDGAELLLPSDGFLELEELPPRVVFVGAGYIGFEFAHIAALAGAEVTVFQRGREPLPRFDSHLVSLLAERTRAMGVDLQLGVEVERVEQQGDGFVVTGRSGDGPVVARANLVVHSAGRVPNLDALDLGAGGVDSDKAGIQVNEYMQSISNPAVYAAGDAAKGGLPLTPVASLEAHVVAANILRGNHRKVEYPPIPSVVFTTPPLTSVGLSEEQATDAGLDFEVHRADTGEWYSARRLAEPASGHAILVDRASKKILGAHLIGPASDEAINLFAMAIRTGMTVSDIKKSIFAYPTVGSNLPHMVG